MLPARRCERALSLLWTITMTYLCVTSHHIHEISPMYAMCHYTAFVCDNLLALIFIYVAACITGLGLCVPAGSPWVILKLQYHSVIIHNHIAHGPCELHALYENIIYQYLRTYTYIIYFMYIRTYVHDIYTSHTYVHYIYIYIMYIYIYICIYVNIYTYIHIYICMYVM